MKILYVASEAAPYAASGGLGDVMGALPASIKKLGGKDTSVTVILPLYRSISDEYRKKMKKILRKDLRVLSRSGESLTRRQVRCLMHIPRL